VASGSVAKKVEKARGILVSDRSGTETIFIETGVSHPILPSICHPRRSIVLVTFSISVHKVMAIIKILVPICANPYGSIPLRR
jgi:hypothetical protein